MSDTAHQAIEKLLYHYADLVDRGDFEGVADLLVHAEVLSGNSVVRGRDNVLAMYATSTRRHQDDGTPKTQHVTTNLILDVDEDAGTARGQSYFTVMQAVTGALALQPIVAGRYEDRFERVGGVWRFGARRIVVTLVGDLSQHLNVEFISRLKE